NMKKLPELIIVVDTKRESTAVKEANTLNIPVLGLADTNSNPDVLDFIIPANDDAVRAIKLLVGALADAVIEGKGMRKSDDVEEEVNADDLDLSQYANDDDSDEAYLGASTLAKLKSATLFEEPAAEAEGEATANPAPDTESKG